MSVARLLKSVFCAASVSCLLFMSAGVYRRWLRDAEEMLATKDKFPQMTAWIDAIVPSQEWVLVVSTLLFFIGYAWLAWRDEPSVLVCAFHGLVAFVLMAGFAVAAPFVPHILRVREIVPHPWFDASRDLPWLAICCVPLAFAAVASWRRKLT